MQTLSIISKNLAKGIREHIYKDDIVLWVQDIQKKEPDDCQVRFLQAKNMEIMLLWGRQTGKTEMAAFKACHKARYEPGTLTLVVSQSQKQAGILQRVANQAMVRATAKIKYGGWKKIKDIEDLEYDPYDLTGESGQIIKKSVLSLELMNESQIISVPALEEAVRGYSPNLIIIDEAAWVKDSVYYAIRPMRAAKPVQLVAISSANATQGFFYEDWKNENIDVLKIKMTSEECPRTTKEFLENERKRCANEDIFLREYFCKFMPPEGSLFTDEMINAMFHLSPGDRGIKARSDEEKSMYISPEGWK